MQRNHHRDHRVHQAFRHLRAIRQQDRRVGHQVPHVPDPHQRAALEGEGRAGRIQVFPIRRQPTLHLAAALLEGLRQCALHQPQPVAVGADLVLGVDAGDRILAVHDRRQRAFQLDIGQQRLIARADEMRPVEDQFDMQAIVPQEDRIRCLRIAAVAHELRGVHQRQVVDQKGPVLHRVAAHIGMAGAGDRENLVQEDPPPGHHAGSPAAFIAARGWQRVHRVGAIKAVIQAAPARISCIQRVAGIRHRHHQLRPWNLGDFGVDVRCLDREGWSLRQQIADLGKESLVGGMVMRLAAPGDVPGVDLCLKLVAPGQQGAVLRREVGQQGGEPGPEGPGLDAGAGQGLVLDEAGEHSFNPKPRTIQTFGHGNPPRPPGRLYAVAHNRRGGRAAARKAGAEFQARPEITCREILKAKTLPIS